MDLEKRLRETMDRHVTVVGVRPMPQGTPRRVGLRRAGRVLLAAALAGAFVAAATSMFQIAGYRPAVRPGAEATAVIPSPRNPDITYMTPTPFADLGSGAWPDVEFGGVEDPYIDRDSDEDPFLLTEKIVVASGYVEGTEWSMTAFGDEYSGDGDLGWGACGELFLGDWGDFGGVRFCQHVADEPGQTDLRIAGTSFGGGPITSYTGVVSGAVDRVEFEFDEGGRRSVDLLKAPAGLENRFFVLFVPNDAAGRVLALDRGGEIIAAEPLCVSVAAEQSDVASCGNGMAWPASAVGSAP